MEQHPRDKDNRQLGSHFVLKLKTDKFYSPDNYLMNICNSRRRRPKFFLAAKKCAFQFLVIFTDQKQNLTDLTRKGADFWSGKRRVQIGFSAVRSDGRKKRVSFL